MAARIAVDEVERFIEATAGGGPAGDGLPRGGPTDAWPAPFDPAVSTDGNRLTASLAVANRSIADCVGRAEELRGMATDGRGGHRRRRERGPSRMSATVAPTCAAPVGCGA